MRPCKSQPRSAAYKPLSILIVGKSPGDANPVELFLDLGRKSPQKTPLFPPSKPPRQLMAAPPERPPATPPRAAGRQPPPPHTTTATSFPLLPHHFELAPPTGRDPTLPTGKISTQKNRRRTAPTSTSRTAPHSPHHAGAPISRAPLATSPSNSARIPPARSTTTPIEGPSLPSAIVDRPAFRPGWSSATAASVVDNTTSQSQPFSTSTNSATTD